MINMKAGCIYNIKTANKEYKELELVGGKNDTLTFINDNDEEILNLEQNQIVGFEELRLFEIPIILEQEGLAGIAVIACKTEDEAYELLEDKISEGKADSLINNYL